MIIRYNYESFKKKIIHLKQTILNKEIDTKIKGREDFMLNRYLFPLFIATLSISCLSAYNQDWQEYKEYKENQKAKEQERHMFKEREGRHYQNKENYAEDKYCLLQEQRNSFEERRQYEEYLEFLEYRRNQEMEERYCEELEKARLCEVSQIDPNKDRLECFKIYLDYLYFKAVEDSLAFTVDTSANPNDIMTSYFAGDFVEPKWKYNSGFRVGIAAPTELGNWEIAASWSYMSSSKNKRTKTSSNFNLYTLQSQLSLGLLAGDPLVNYAKGNWKLNFNVIDITLESPIYINNSLKIRPIIGVQGSIINQKTSVSYSTFLIDNIFANPPQEIRGKNNTWGVGPKLGLGITLAMPYEINLNFLASFASLFGKGKAKTTYSNFLQSVVGGTKLSSDTTRLFSQLQLQGALEKVWEFQRNCASLSIAVGWEAQTWFRQLRLNYYGTVENPSAGSDLTLQGPFARILLEF